MAQKHWPAEEQARRLAGLGHGRKNMGQAESM